MKKMLLKLLCLVIYKHLFQLLCNDSKVVGKG